MTDPTLSHGIQVWDSSWSVFTCHHHSLLPVWSRDGVCHDYWDVCSRSWWWSLRVAAWHLDTSSSSLVTPAVPAVEQCVHQSRPGVSALWSLTTHFWDTLLSTSANTEQQQPSSEIRSYYSLDSRLCIKTFEEILWQLTKLFSLGGEGSTEKTLVNILSFNTSYLHG